MQKSIMNRLPYCCAATDHEANETVFIVRGFPGYRPMKPMNALKGVVAYEQMSAKKWNETHGVTDAQYNAMMIGSMFGWEVPGVESALDAGN